MHVRRDEPAREEALPLLSGIEMRAMEVDAPADRDRDDEVDEEGIVTTNRGASAANAARSAVPLSAGKWCRCRKPGRTDGSCM